MATNLHYKRKQKLVFLHYLLIGEVGNTDFIVFIDDFHYIPRDIQSKIAKQIKEAMRH